ncbi:MAG: protein translocase subunit SecF [Rhodospirillaceae bacterium]|nr:protein translocase subunit SecF [Rhodospirillaceae bacterium]
MKTIRLIPDKTNIRFLEKRKLALTLSACLVVVSLALFFGRGLNLGIDFLGGILLEVKTDGPADLSDLRTKVSDLGLGDTSLQEFGANDTVLIRVQRQEGGDDAQKLAVDKIKEGLAGAVVEYRRTEFVGPTVGAELKEAAIWAVLAAVGAILLYIWFRFEWQFGVGAVIALTHDVITTIGLFALLQLEFNVSTVAAVLTIAGYSINDTVVVYDRVRENLRRYKRLSLIELFNRSINETLARTVMTSVTTLLALLALYFFGGEVIQGFTIALIWGVFVGTYSSIALAVPLLVFFKIDRRAISEEDDAEEAQSGS